MNSVFTIIHSKLTILIYGSIGALPICVVTVRARALCVRACASTNTRISESSFVRYLPSVHVRYMLSVLYVTADPSLLQKHGCVSDTIAIIFESCYKRTIALGIAKVTFMRPNGDISYRSTSLS